MNVQKNFPYRIVLSGLMACWFCQTMSIAEGQAGANKAIPFELVGYRHLKGKTNFPARIY